MSYLTVQPRFGTQIRPKAVKPEEDKLPPPTAQNGIWVATERIPAKNGGLGEVSKTIPEAIANLMPAKDLRIIVPYLTPHAEFDRRHPEQAFENTGVSLRMECHDGVTRDFTILQKFEPVPGQTKKGNWVYAIRNDEMFRAKLKDPKTGVEQDAGLQKYTYNPKAGEYEKVMMFNWAAAKLIPLLNGENAAPGNNRLHRFGDAASINPDRKHIDFVMAHDWLAGPVLYELPNKETRRKIFMLHNKYDKIQIPKVAKGIGLQRPQNLYDKEDLYSPLHLGLASADAVIGEHNFVHSLLTTPLGKGEQFVKALREKHEQQQRHVQSPNQYRPVIYDMHHGLAADFTPIGKNEPDTFKAPNALQESRETWIEKLCQAKEKELTAAKAPREKIAEALRAIRAGKQSVKAFQFEPLKSSDLKDIQRFKEANKLALQRKLGLEEDKDAIIMGWAARLEPRQKGFFLVQYCMEKLLAENELKAQGKMPGKKVQFVIYGDTADSELKKWIEQKNARFGTGDKGKKWLYMPNRFANHIDIKQLSAGGDFTILPSIYEPYGLTQLEAMKMCTIPIVHGVDGLRSSVTDKQEVLPEVYKSDFTDPRKREKVWDYPQNGFLMAPLDWKYMDYIDRRQEAESVLSLLKAVDHPEGSAARISYDERLKNLSNRLEDAVGSRKSKRATLKKELSRAEEGKTDSASLKTQIDHLERQIQEITRWQRSMTGGGVKLSSEGQEALTNIFALSPAEQTINETESGKLLSAIRRAIQVAGEKPDELLQIRRNGMDYVDREHTWNAIVSRRYRPIMEDESNMPRPEIPAAPFRKPLNPPPVETWDNPANWTPMSPASKPGEIDLKSAWSDLWSLPSQLAAFLMRMMGLRMD